MAQKILITGANAGLGKESAKQFAQLPETQKIYLGVRNLAKGQTAKKELEQLTGKKIFELIQVDVSSLNSTKVAVEALPEKIDALVLNAGGIGGKTPLAVSANGVTDIAAQNILGHVSLVDELIKKEKLSGVVMFAGSEVTRGVAKFGLKKPALKNYNEDEFKSILNGSFFKKNADPMEAYAYVKLIGTLWVGSMARKNRNIRFVTASPGATTGTEVANDANAMFKFLMKTEFGKKLGGVFGLTHDLSTGAKRYIDVVNDQNFASGGFYASKSPKAAVGKLSDQKSIDNVFYNESFQDSAYKAIHSFITPA